MLFSCGVFRKEVIYELTLCEVNWIINSEILSYLPLVTNKDEFVFLFGSKLQREVIIFSLIYEDNKLFTEILYDLCIQAY